MSSFFDKSSGFFGKITAIVLVTSTILQTYGYGKYDFAFIATSLLAVINLLFNNGQKSLPKFLLFYICYWLISHVVTASSYSSAIPIGIIKTLIVYLLFFDNINLRYMIRVYKYIAIVCVAFFWFQESMYFTTGSRIPGLFTFLPIAIQMDVASYLEQITIAARSSSFFSEPAHFAQFLLPLLALSLFDNHSKRKHIMSVIITLTLVYLQSGNGLIGLAAIYVFYILYLVFVKKNSAKKVFALVALLIIGFWGGYKYMDSQMGQYIMSRQDQLSIGATSGNSGFIRIYRGYFVYQMMPPIEKVIGNDDPASIQMYIKQSPVHSYFLDNGDMYFNTIQSTLIRTGIIGMILFILIILSFWKGQSYCGKAILLCFVALSFVSALHFTETMCLYLIIPYLMKKQNILEYA